MYASYNHNSLVSYIYDPLLIHSFTICNTLQRGYLNSRQLLQNNYTIYNFIYPGTNKENTSAAVIAIAICY